MTGDSMVVMSEILDKLPEGRYRALTPHPFDTWTDGRVHKLIKGQDYHCTFEALERQLRRQGQARKLITRIRKLPDGLAVQFSPR